MQPNRLNSEPPATTGGIRESITKPEGWLQHKAKWLVGVLALVLGASLIYEDLHGLELMPNVVASA